MACVEGSDHVLRRALQLVIEGQAKKRRPKRWMRQVEEETCFEHGKYTLPIKAEFDINQIATRLGNLANLTL